MMLTICIVKVHPWPPLDETLTGKCMVVYPNLVPRPIFPLIELNGLVINYLFKVAAANS